MIRHHVHALSKIHNLKEIVLIGCFDPKAFESFIATVEGTYKIPCKYWFVGNLKLDIIRNPKRLELLEDYINMLIRSLRRTCKFGNSELSNRKNYFVLHCDIACSFPLEQLLEFHRGHGKMCTIMSVQVSKEETQNYGCLIKNEETKELVHYVEKPDFFVSDLINTGVYIFTSKIVEVLAEAKKAKEIVKKIEFL